MSALLSAPRARTAEAHLARVKRCALAMDARRWGAHATAVDALWAGVGLLTSPGETLASRATHSLTHAVDLAPLSVHSLREYADLAHALLRPRRTEVGIDRVHRRHAMSEAPRSARGSAMKPTMTGDVPIDVPLFP